MARFIVEGGTPLRGEITPAGNKNEALPLIAASLLTDEPVTLRNVPRIRDVRGMLEIASALGARVEELDSRSVRVTGGLRSTEVPAALAGEIRTSLLFAGPLLARYKKVKLGLPGGDVIGRRRNDTHFLALRALGAELDASPSGYGLHTAGLRGADLLLDEPSVTATENALMAAVLAKGRTVIRNAASEPHVQQLGAAEDPPEHDHDRRRREPKRDRAHHPRRPHGGGLARRRGRDDPRRGDDQERRYPASPHDPNGVQASGRRDRDPRR